MYEHDGDRYDDGRLRSGQGYSSGGAGVMSDSPTPVRETEISARSSELARETEVLHNNLAMLEKRLNSILSNGGAATKESASTRAPQSVMLASFLSEQADRVASANARIHDLIQRIEL